MKKESHLKLSISIAFFKSWPSSPLQLNISNGEVRSCKPFPSFFRRIRWMFSLVETFLRFSAVFRVAFLQSLLFLFGYLQGNFGNSTNQRLKNPWRNTGSLNTGKWSLEKRNHTKKSIQWERECARVPTWCLTDLILFIGASRPSARWKSVKEWPQNSTTGWPRECAGAV